ncbi:YybH family protein [Leucobacter sp. HY1910]
MTQIDTATPAQRAELLEVERRRQQALIDGDLETLRDIFDDSIVHVHAPGVVQNKTELLEHVEVRRPYLEMTRGELTLRVAGDTAIITGALTNRMRAPGGGERTLSGPVTQVLVRGDDGAWRFVSFHMTPYGEKAWGDLPSEQRAAQERVTAEGATA